MPQVLEGFRSSPGFVDNVATVREAIRGGEHGSMLYAGHKSDVLRLLLAYDPTTITFLSSTSFEISTDRLRNVIPELDVVESEDTTEIHLDVEGKRRRLIHTKQGSMARGAMDIYYGRRDWFLDVYDMVSEGGFFVFYEKPLAERIPASLLFITGLNELPIIRGGRTSVEDHEGVVYRKIKRVDLKILRSALDLLGSLGVADETSFEAKLKVADEDLADQGVSWTLIRKLNEEARRIHRQREDPTL